MHTAVSAFIEQMGLVSEANGFSRIAGRMIGFHLVDERPHSLDDIAEKLSVSKGSVSTNARTLEQFGIIERHSVPGDRRDYYRISDRPWEKMHALFERRMMRVLNAFEKGLAELPDDMEETRRRLEAWRSFYTFLIDDSRSTLRRWKAWRSRHVHAAGEETATDERSVSGA